MSAWGYHANGLNAVLIEAVKELTARVNELDAKVKELGWTVAEEKDSSSK